MGFVYGPGKKKRKPRPTWAGFVQNYAPPLSEAERDRFTGKHVLITGAGGYLGSALARQLAATDAAHLTLLDLSEYGLYRIDQTLRASQHVTEYSVVIGSVTDRALLRQVFASHAPDYIFHAAARKHVPLMEENVVAAAEANVLGTLALVEAAQQAGTEGFVLLSTDKAVAPISVMGATKRVAEQIVLAARVDEKAGADFKCVRLCNVLGSTGSVAPLFARQIASGGPLTVTDPEVTRFFITLRDAVRHTLRAMLTESRTGLLVPAIECPFPVLDLARHMLANTPSCGNSVPIQFTGLRTADKLHEQLIGDGEVATRVLDGLIPEAASSFDRVHLGARIEELARAVTGRDRSAVIQALEHLVPEYRATKAAFADEVLDPA